MTKVRWGLVGAGRIAETFARDMALADNAVLLAVGARTPDRANDFARRHGVRSAYGSYQDVYEDPDVDAVYVATPHTLHAEHAIRLAGIGTAVSLARSTSPALHTGLAAAASVLLVVFLLTAEQL